MSNNNDRSDQSRSRSRRDLLRHFAIGTIIAPVVAGNIVEAAAARLIEIPNVESIAVPLTPTPPRIPSGNMVSTDSGVGEGRSVHVILRDKHPRNPAIGMMPSSEFHFPADRFRVTHTVYQHSDRSQLAWTLEGTMDYDSTDLGEIQSWFLQF